MWGLQGGVDEGDEGGYGGTNGDGRRGGGEHTTQCTGDVLRNCAPEACRTLLNSATPINPIKKGGKRSVFHVHV